VTRGRDKACALAALLALAVGARADEAAKSSPPSTSASAAEAKPGPPPCSTPEHRAFDFWLGAWRVERPDGQLAGHNTISAILDGCALLEQWEGASGFRGTSLNAWDAGAKRWRQTWMDASGGVLLLEGGLENGAMVMRGVTRDAQGEQRERITWTPLAGGRVKQHWEQSRDGGGTWSDAFVGIYVRR
jgi:hypothetical protein